MKKLAMCFLGIMNRSCVCVQEDRQDLPRQESGNQIDGYNILVEDESGAPVLLENLVGKKITWLDGSELEIQNPGSLGKGVREQVTDYLKSSTPENCCTITVPTVPNDLNMDCAAVNSIRCNVVLSEGDSSLFKCNVDLSTLPQGSVIHENRDLLVNRCSSLGPEEADHYSSFKSQCNRRAFWGHNPDAVQEAFELSVTPRNCRSVKYKLDYNEINRSIDGVNGSVGNGPAPF